MAKELKRKLTAILSADVKGYSGLMEEDSSVNFFAFFLLAVPFLRLD
jgi:hypothetical protein